MFNDDGRRKIILLRRDDGYWVLPKGHKLLDDDSIETTAIREVSEETGLSRSKLVIDEYVEHYSYDETSRSLGVDKVVHLYLMRYVGETLPPLQVPDHAEGRWWPIDEEFPKMKSHYQATFVKQIALRFGSSST